jgi:ABC-2 type transport system ATP-binding protein
VRSPPLQELGDALHRAGHQVVSAGPGAIDVVGPTAAEIGELAASMGATLHELSPRTASLEDVFLEVTAGAQQYRGDGDAADPPQPTTPAPASEPTDGGDR